MRIGLGRARLAVMAVLAVSAFVLLGSANAASGRQRFTFPDGDYVPLSGNGGRLLLHGYSRLYAVEPRRR